MFRKLDPVVSVALLTTAFAHGQVQIEHAKDHIDDSFHIGEKVHVTIPTVVTQCGSDDLAAR